MANLRMVNKCQKNKPETRQWSLINQAKKKTKKIDNNNQYNTKRAYAAALRNNRPVKQQNKAETKIQQHDEILSNHNHHARNTSYTRSNTDTINCHEEEPKNLKHASI